MYEPMRVLLPDGTSRRGSALTLGELIEAGGNRVLHEYCYLFLEQPVDGGAK